MMNLLPEPTNIREQMPELSAMLRQLAAPPIGRNGVERMIKKSLAMMRAYAAKDSAAYRRLQCGEGCVNGWIENGFQLGLTSAQHATMKGRQHGA